MSEHRTIQPGVLAGLKLGCPFCLARSRDLPKVGERVRILAEDMRTGDIGTVVENSFGIPLRCGEVLLQMDGASGYTVWDTTGDLLGPIPDAPLPYWALPLYLEKAEKIDRLVVKFYEESVWEKKQVPNWAYFYDLIGYVWWNRLPIDPDEMWKFLKAHGIPSNRKNRCTKLYQEGIALLIHVTHRKPYQTNRAYPPKYLRKYGGSARFDSI